MAKRNVIWTKTADLQLIGVLEYWVARNGSNRYSKKLLKIVIKSTTQISENPKLHKKTDFKNIRVAIKGNYSIYYKYSNKEIIIMGFWDNRQNPKRLLSILKTME